jgi:protein-L-isoaspartate O-methyltransferase
MSDPPYVGRELDVFARAKNWKRYWSSCVRRFVRGDVLEVGAGIGANTPLLAPHAAGSWICLEPDANLARRAAASLALTPATSGCHVIVGTTHTLPGNYQFDALLYIDVLEHIQQHKEELDRAAFLLKKGGHLIVLSPAHQWLYTEFDRSVGHCRRYDRASLTSCTPGACSLERLWYLDSAGMLASCGNLLLLHQSMPSLRQITFWDRYLVRASTAIDRLLFHRVGKSILAVWRKE